MPAVGLTSHHKPFGMVIPVGIGNWQAGGAGGYRFGFNGKEGDSEIKGEDNSLDFGARIYDPRLGSFLTTDPKESEYAWQSVYAYFSNSPIHIIDFNGEGKEKNKDKDIKKFRKHEEKLAKKEFGINDYSLATPDQVMAVRDRMEQKFKKRSWMWSWSNGPDQEEFSKNNSNQLDQATSRYYSPMREIVDQADGLLIATNASQNVPYTILSTGATITFTADLSGIAVDQGLELRYSFSGMRTITANIYQDNVAGGTTMKGSPAARQIAGPVVLSPGRPSVTTAINVANGNFVTITITDRSLALLGAVSPSLIAHSQTVQQPKEYHVTDSKGHYGFWRGSVKREIFRQAGY